MSIDEHIRYVKEGLKISILLSIAIIISRIALISLGFIDW